MADDLDPVEQKFIADVEPYIEAVKRAADDARKFADANLEATAAVNELRDHALEASAALGHLRDEALLAAEAEKRAADDTSTLHSEVGKLVATADKAASEGGIFRKLLFGGNKGIGSLGDSLGSGAEGIPLIGGAGLPGLAAAIPVLYAVIAEVAGLVGGLAAAGAGAAAFAALAVPAFDKVKTAYTNVTAAQAAYHKAQLTESMDPTKANAAAVAKALLGLREAWHGLDPAERGAVHGIQDFMATYQRMVKAFEPDAFKIFNDGLRIANELLPAITPFARTFATVLDGLLKQAAGFFKITEPLSSAARGLGLVGDASKSALTPFGQWLQQFHALEGPSVHAIGEGIGRVAVAIGKLLTVMSAKDVVNAINIAFAVLAGTIDVLVNVVSHLMHSWDELSSGLQHTRRDVDNWRHDVAEAFDEVRHAVAEAMDAVVTRVEQDVDRVRDSIERWDGDLNRAVAWWRALPGRILAALASLPGRMLSLGRAIIDGLLSGIESAAGGLLGEVERLGHDISSVFASAMRSLSPSRVFHEHGVNIVQGLINGIQAAKPGLLALMRELGGQTSTGFAGPGGASYAGGTAPSVHVTVPVTLAAGAAAYNDPRFLQYLQGVVQEAVLRYTQVNPSNGLHLAGKIS